MPRPLPRHDDAVAAQRDLRDDIRPARILAPHFVDLLFERQFLGDRLQRRDGDRQPGFAAQIAPPLKLVPLALQVPRHFEPAVADPAHYAGDLYPPLRRSRRAGDETSGSAAGWEKGGTNG